MDILVTGEESQTICNKFRMIGHEAYSCDIQECSGGHPEWHIRDDYLNVIPIKIWDIIIFHPDCTYMAVSGNAHYGTGKLMHKKRMEAIEWTVNIWNLICKHSKCSVLENPVSVIFQYLRGGVFTIRATVSIWSPGKQKDWIVYTWINAIKPNKRAKTASMWILE